MEKSLEFDFWSVNKATRLMEQNHAVVYADGSVEHFIEGQLRAQVEAPHVEAYAECLPEFAEAFQKAADAAARKLPFIPAV